MTPLKISQTIRQVDYVHNGRNGQNALQVHNPLFVVADSDLDRQFHPVNTPQHAKLDSLDLSQDHVEPDQDLVYPDMEMGDEDNPLPLPLGQPLTCPMADATSPLWI